jgi:hypothetical protein
LSCPNRPCPSPGGGWIGQGKLRYHETVVDGIENTLGAFLALMRGETLGKMVVRHCARHQDLLKLPSPHSKKDLAMNNRQKRETTW